MWRWRKETEEGPKEEEENEGGKGSAGHISTTHRRLKIVVAAALASGDGAAGAARAARFVSPPTWLPVRLMALVLPFVCLWIALSFGFSDSNKNNSGGWVLVAAAAYALTSLGTLAPTLCFLNDRALATSPDGGGGGGGRKAGGRSGGGWIIKLNYEDNTSLMLLPGPSN